MFALHWICALTLVLVSCLNAKPVKKDAGELLKRIPELNRTIEEIGCPNNISLKSPFDIRKDCMSSALNCTLQQLDLLMKDCHFPEDDVEAIENVIFQLRQIKHIPPNSNSDCSCEMYKPTDVKQFLNNMIIQVQQVIDMQRQLTNQ